MKALSSSKRNDIKGVSGPVPVTDFLSTLAKTSSVVRQSSVLRCLVFSVSAIPSSDLAQLGTMAHRFQQKVRCRHHMR